MLFGNIKKMWIVSSIIEQYRAVLHSDEQCWVVLSSTQHYHVAVERPDRSKSGARLNKADPNWSAFRGNWPH